MKDRSIPALPQKPRLEWLDIAKGIGIFLVVYGHSIAPYNLYAYYFHMPLFMILSGFLYQPKQSFRTFLWKKICSLYIPYVGWNLIVIGGRLLDGAALGVFHKMLPGQLTVIRQVFLCVGKDGKYMGATWFLGSLFMISIVYRLVDLIVPKWKYRQLVILAFFGGAAAFGFLYTLPYMQSRTVILSFFYALGPVFHEITSLLRRFSRLVMVFLFDCLFLCLRFVTGPAKMGENVYGRPPVFLLDAIAGSLFVILFSMWLEKRRLSLWKVISVPFRTMGRNSMDILLWQFSGFYVVVLVQLRLEGQPFRQILYEKSRYNVSGRWWIAYLAAGILLPLAWGWVLKHGPWGKLLKKIHLV